MKRVFLALCMLITMSACQQQQTLSDGAADRKEWVDMMTRIVDPVLRNTAAGTLKQNMPYESIEEGNNQIHSYLEALGRTICGIAPWLEQEDGESDIKEEYRELSRKAIANAVDPESPDYMCFVENHRKQALVDASYLAEGLLRAPKQLWGALDKQTQENIITVFTAVRSIKPGENNWLLFASTVEAALLEFTGECDVERMQYGVNRFKNDFYKGDGFYGDGAAFHMDYYNSYVIHPMLLDVLIVMERHKIEGYEFIDVERKRHTRYSEILERQVAPDGTYPIVGRTIAACRTGAFHALSQSALLGMLPEKLSPAQVRSALTAVILRQFENPDNFDAEGWLRVGVAGAQLEVSESYVNTGSLYHCATVFLALGLPTTDPFWSDDYEPWTGIKAWSGMKIYPDKALKD